MRLLIDTLKSNPEPSFPGRGKGKFPATAFPVSGPMQSVLFIADGLAEVTGGGMQQERADSGWVQVTELKAGPSPTYQCGQMTWN